MHKQFDNTTYAQDNISVQYNLAGLNTQIKVDGKPLKCS